ncbi:hypothetical protein cypCar_00047476 [Cyprinus carpio]|nr:hypothetical protein cypCar_00047476 [Cyprinus carpio]
MLVQSAQRVLFTAVMSPRGSASLFLLLLLNLNLQCVSGGKVIVWPSEFSHWLNVKVILDALISRGHNITVVTHTATPSVNTTPSMGYNVDILQVPHTKQDILENMERMLKYWTHDLPNDNVIKASMKLKGMIDLATEQNQAVCRELFARKDLLEKWRKEKFDVLLADPLFMCGELLAQKLNLPLILSLRFFSDLTFTHCGNVLVLPGEYSHWYNMRNIVGELLNRIHSVTVLVNSASPTTSHSRRVFSIWCLMCL